MKQIHKIYNYMLNSTWENAYREYDVLIALLDSLEALLRMKHLS